MKKLKNSKGFTLMEMLIVVAIIAVLVAIAIPTFTNQLEKAREAADMANLRSAYAEVVAAALTDDNNNGRVTVGGVEGSGERTYTVEVTATKHNSTWLGGTPTIGDATVPGTALVNGAVYTVQYNEQTSAVTIAAKS